MFQYHQFKIANEIRAGTNISEIKFKSPVKFLEEAKEQGATKGVEYIRKAQCMFGWDWGIRLPDSGIWKDIYIEYGNNAKLNEILITQNHQNNKVNLGFEMEEINGITDNCHLISTLYDPQRILLHSKNLALTGMCKDNFVIENPQLWWPNGYGSQPLYEIVFELFDGNQLVDKKKFSIGLRTVYLNREDEGDGSKYEFVVNNVPIFAKGTNLIIQDAIISRSSSKELEELINNCVLANMNFIRVWGGAYYPSDYFFELCNKHGILVYIDCMFTSTFYPISEEFLENVKIEIEQNVKRIRNHACLALICGNNELDLVYTILTSNDPETDELRDFFEVSKLEDETIKQHIWTSYNKLFLEVIPRS